MPAGNVHTQSRTVTGSTGENAKYGLHQHGYILGQTLGSGSYGKVKCARSLKLKVEVAVKMISKKSAPKDILNKFLPREIEALRKVEHKNTVKLYEVIHTNDYICLVMELAENGDLLDFINSRKYLSEKTARALFTDLVDGISKCHEMNVVHRDLKCENLLLDSQHRLLISDFGFARTLEGKQLLETSCGSYAYAAPEVIMGDSYKGESADIWSMAVILYAMVTGRLPFKDSDVKSLLCDISKLLRFPSRVSDECKDLIRAMLTFNPKERATLDEIKTHSWMRKLPESRADAEKVHDQTPEL